MRQIKNRTYVFRIAVLRMDYTYNLRINSIRIVYVYFSGITCVLYVCYTYKWVNRY